MPGSINSFMSPESMMFGGLGAGIGQLGANWQNPAEAGKKGLEGYYKPWMDTGQQAFQHPGETINQIGQNYQQSPGYQFALQQALQAAQHSQNAGGMAGSPQAQQQQMQVATGLANQDYNNWLQNALKEQMGGGEIGYNATNELGGNTANLNYLGAQQGNQHSSGLGSLLGLVGGIAGNAFAPGLGGILGGAAGSALGRIFG